MALILAVGLVEVSSAVGGDALARWPRLFGAGADGARAVLSTIAGSVITVAGVTFSITIAALALASAQYTPRVLRTFMADRANQLVLGTFVGVFVYCLVVLRTIRGGDEGAFVPSIAVLGGVVLALVGVAVLIFFVHHITDALQASTILQRVRVATEGAIHTLFPEDAGSPAEDVSADLDHATRDWRAIPSAVTGYVQGADATALADLARDHGGVIRMECGVGDFIVKGDPVASFAPIAGETRAARHADATQDDLRRRVLPHYAIASYRTVEQDAAFGILQIVDVALKALSTGVNDTTTAVTAVDHLGAVLALLGPRRIPARLRTTDTTLRLIARGPTYDSLVSLALDDVRRNAAGNVRVLLRVCDVIDVAARHTPDARRRSVLAAQIALVEEVAGRTIAADNDRDTLARRARDVRRAVAGNRGERGA